jgi:hypothetical protein
MICEVTIRPTFGLDLVSRLAEADRGSHLFLIFVLYVRPLPA